MKNNQKEKKEFLRLISIILKYRIRTDGFQTPLYIPMKEIKIEIPYLKWLLLLLKYDNILKYFVPNVLKSLNLNPELNKHRYFAIKTKKPIKYYIGQKLRRTKNKIKYLIIQNKAETPKIQKYRRELIEQYKKCDKFFN
jgi:hypothetical protein